MSVIEEIYQHSLRLPEEDAKQALAFILFLEQRSLVQQKIEQVYSRQLGTLKDKVQVKFSDDWGMTDAELLNT